MNQIGKRMRGAAVLAWGFATFLGWGDCPAVWGQSPPAADLSPAVLDAARLFRPVTAEQAAGSKAELNSALQELEESLLASGEVNAAAWKKYLSWDALTAIAQKPDPPDANRVAAIHRKFVANEQGLELARFIRVRRALREYQQLAAAAANPKLADDYLARLNGLAGSLAAHAQNPSTDEALKIGRTLGWLSKNRQADSLVQLVQNRYWQPNIYAAISQRFLSTVVEEPIEQTQPIQDEILGTAITGVATMRGQTSLQLTPNDNVGQLEILLTGAISTRSTGLNRGVTILSTATTSVSGRKTLCLTGETLYGCPAAANCNTSSSIDEICAKRRIVERIAWRKAGQSQGQAETIASQHAAARISQQMDERAAALIAENNSNLEERLRAPLRRLDLLPRDLRFRTGSDRLEAVTLQVRPGQAAAHEPPPAAGVFCDLLVRAHETSVINLGETLLGGVELTDERLEKIIRVDLKAEVPEELKVTQDKDPWSITFADEAPVRAVFEPDGLKFAIRGRRFSRGEQRLNVAVEISAAYKWEKMDGGVKLKRQGDVRVEFLEPEKIGPTQRVTYKTFLAKKFGALFKPEFASDGIELKDRLAKAGKLRLMEIKSERGWIMLGWNLVPLSSAPLFKVAGR